MSRAYDAIHNLITGRPMPEERPAPVCSTCEGGGWVEVYSPYPPAFEVCPDCLNPEELESP